MTWKEHMNPPEPNSSRPWGEVSPLNWVGEGGAGGGAQLGSCTSCGGGRPLRCPGDPRPRSRNELPWNDPQGPLRESEPSLNPIHSQKWAPATWLRPLGVAVTEVHGVVGEMITPRERGLDKGREGQSGQREQHKLFP